MPFVDIPCVDEDVAEMTFELFEMELLYQQLNKYKWLHYCIQDMQDTMLWILSSSYMSWYKLKKKWNLWKMNATCWSKPTMSLPWGEYLAWLQRCDECIEQLEEHSRAKRSRLSIGNRQSLVARIARLEGAKIRLQRRFIHFGSDYTSTSRSSDAKRLVWREIDTAFENRILTGAVINADSNRDNVWKTPVV